MGLVDQIAEAERGEAIHRSQGEVTQHIRHAVVPDVVGEIARVVADCDPMGFLADVVNGKAIESHTVSINPETEEPVIETLYTTPTLSQRISVARYLGNKYMPNVSVTKVIADPPPDPDKPKSHYEQIMDNAANAANAKDVTPTPQQDADNA